MCVCRQFVHGSTTCFLLLLLLKFWLLFSLILFPNRLFYCECGFMSEALMFINILSLGETEVFE